MEDTPAVPVLIGGGPAMNQGTVILIHADSRTLNTRMYDTKGELLNEFSTGARLRPIWMV